MVYFWKSADYVFQTAKAKKHCILNSIFYLNEYFQNTYCTLKQHSMSTCRHNKHTQRHLVEAENAISNCENLPQQYDYLWQNQSIVVIVEGYGNLTVPTR